MRAGDLHLTMQDLHPDTKTPNDPPVVIPRLRYAAGEAWDELGGVPDDLDAWVLCFKCADGGGDLLAAKHPVTNLQFERFIQAAGYQNRGLLGRGRRPWLALAGPVEHPSYHGEKEVTQPEYWNDPRFGKDRRGYPVVGVPGTRPPRMLRG